MPSEGFLPTKPKEIPKYTTERCGLEVQTLDPATILITEHNIYKHKEKEIFGDTFHRVKDAIESGKESEIPPIVAFQNPFESIEDTIKAYEAYSKVYLRQGGKHYDNEKDVLKKVLERNFLLCYNGNRRLEEFQKAKIPIKAFVIKSEEQFTQIPSEEKRIPEKVKNEREKQYKIDQNYLLSFLMLLDDVVFILAEKEYYDGLDTKKVINALRKRRGISQQE